jgi:hypothetical protein
MDPRTSPLVDHQLRPHDDPSVIRPLAPRQPEDDQQTCYRHDSTRRRPYTRILDRLCKGVQAREARFGRHSCSTASLQEGKLIGIRRRDVAAEGEFWARRVVYVQCYARNAAPGCGGVVVVWRKVRFGAPRTLSKSYQLASFTGAMDLCVNLRSGWLYRSC